jgi:hypothetical protein
MTGTSVGKYRIIGPLGRGGTGMVYKAVDETLGREVAVKALNPDLADTDILKRFRAEAAILARLNHPHIATIYELFLSGTELLMVMELICGDTLEQLSNRVGPMPPARAAYFLDRILSALEHAHHAGVVHRDMKPANVMVTEAGGVKIMDFGVARVRGAEHVTVDGFVVGTPAYMAPEQVLAHEVDGRADLYSAGVMFYRLLTGTLPFNADTPAGQLHQQITESPAPLSNHRADLPEWCESIVHRALAKAPADRFQTAGEFREALGRATGIVVASDLGNESAATDGLKSAAPPRITTAVLSPNEAGLPALHRAAGHLRTYNTKAASMLGVFALVVAVLAYGARGKAEPVPETSPVAVPLPKAVPTLVFRAKTLVGGAGRLKEREAQLLLADGTITLAADDDSGAVLHRVAYNGVLSINYSLSRHPMWNGPKGPATLVRAPGGTLRLLGVAIERHWISLRTNTANRFVILRVDESQIERLLSALEDRTGCHPKVVGTRTGI